MPLIAHLEPNKRKAIIVDLDGTLANCSHRLHFINRSDGQKDWDSFYKHLVYDKRINRVADLVEQLADIYDTDILIVTGRPSHTKDDTQDWLFINYERVIDHYELFMREDGDHRPDYVVKKEIYEKYIRDNYDVVAVLEDRTQVVKMWRNKGC